MKKVILFLTLAAVLASCSYEGNTFYTVSFNTDGGTPVSSQEVLKGKKAVEPKSPEKDGYIFSRWTIDDEEYDFTAPVVGNITLKAEYTEDEWYTVTFDSDNGSVLWAQRIKKNAAAIEPKSPEKNGFTFKYWALGDDEYVFSSPVTKDITLKAKYDVSNDVMKVQAKRIYSVADILVNKTNLSGGATVVTSAFTDAEDAGTLVVTALDRDYSEDQLHMDNSVYNPEDYSFDIQSTSSLENNTSSKSGNTTNIVIGKLDLKVRICKDPLTILSTDIKEAIFTNVNIMWKETSANAYEGTISYQIDNNVYQLEFKADGNGLKSAVYNGITITF